MTTEKINIEAQSINEAKNIAANSYRLKYHKSHTK